MKISWLERRLKNFREAHGDLPIKMCWNEFYMSFDPELPVSDLWIAKVMGDHVLLVPSRCLEHIDYSKDEYNVTG